jgi:integrase
MAIVKLTMKEVQTQILAVIAAPKDTFLYDKALSGFGCKITKTGSASWFVEKRFAGSKAIRKKLGNYPGMPIEEARRQCQIMLGQLAAGVDISKDRRATVALQREAMNGKTLSAWFVEWNKIVYEEAKKPGSRKYRKEQLATFNNWVMPVLGQTPIKLISQYDISDLTDSLPVCPRRSVDSLFRPFFRWLCNRRVIDASPMAMIKRPKAPTPRQRTLTDDEIQGFWHAARRMGAVYGAFYKLLLLLASRKGETQRMKWTDLDLVRREWRIPAEETKTQQTHIVHLSDEATQVLGQLNRGESPFVFANGDGQPICAGSEPWHVLLALMSHPLATSAEIRKKAKWTYEGVLPQINIEAFTQHDLRRTVSTRMVGDLGVVPWVADKIQNHVAESTVRRTYQVVEYLNERRTAIEAWGAYVSKLVGGD